MKNCIFCRRFLIAKALFLVLLFIGCASSDSPPDTSTPPITSTPPEFANGGDVSWLPQMEESGYKFYDEDGTEKDCLQLLKDRGINTIRLRVWVNPSSNPQSGHCSPEETVVMAVRAKAMGMRIMINFHYSDTWADPGHQTKPAAWVGHTVEELGQDVYNHTFDVLTKLKEAGVTPEWVQVGNETSSGMLWPEGDLFVDGISGYVPQALENFAIFLNKGYEATKAVNNNIKVIIHLNKGEDDSRWYFNLLRASNVKYDVIGLSYYPRNYVQNSETNAWELSGSYTSKTSSLTNNLKNMASIFKKEVMVVEIGGIDHEEGGTKQMISDVIKAVKSIPNYKGLGVIYWEPQGESGWSGYPMSAWQSVEIDPLDATKKGGRPSIALDAFKE